MFEFLKPKKSEKRKKIDAIMDDIVGKIHYGNFKSILRTLEKKTHITDGHYRIWIPTDGMLGRGGACDVEIELPYKVKLPVKNQKKILKAWHNYCDNKIDANVDELYDELKTPIINRVRLEHELRMKDSYIKELYEQYQTALKMKYGEQLAPNEWLDDKIN